MTIDGDGIGQCAFLSQLASERLPGREEPWSPVPLFPSSYSKLSPAGTIERPGYLFRVFLPGHREGGKLPGLAEQDKAQPASEFCEQAWCAYAWPALTPDTGQRSFFINQAGRMLELPKGYSGEDAAPHFDAALSIQAAELPSTWEQPSA